MVKLDAVRAANTTLVQSQPLVAVFFGGTGGIGHQTLNALSAAEAKHGGKGLRAYIVGRNAQAAEAFITESRTLCRQGDFKFIKAEDLSLITEVNRLCDAIIRSEEEHGSDGRIDYLMLSHGGIVYLPRKDTKEGIDVTMSLLYYSRMRIVTNLLPLLLRSRLPAATVVSVYAAGMEGDFHPDDLSLRDLKIYSYSLARSHMCYMHSLFFAALAQQHPGKLNLIHVFPGLVPGPGFHNPEYPLWFRVLFNYIMAPLFGWLIFVKPGQCGERMLSLASPRYLPISETTGKGSDAGQAGAITGTDGKALSGTYSLNWDGESNHPEKKYEGMNKEEMRRKVWDHTMNCFEVIETGRVFAE